MANEPKVFAGPNVLLMGPAGTGKTHSIGTLVDSGIEVFYLGLESGLESLIGYWSDRGLPVPPNLHWHILEWPNISYKELETNARKILTLDYESLTKMKDNDRVKYDMFLRIQTLFCDFEDQRTGQKFGAVDDWGNNRAIVIDGMTGLSRAAMSAQVGGKPVRSPSDFGVAQDQLEVFLRMTCDQCKCWFVLIAHVEREIDLVLGGSKISVSTLGKALPHKIPPMFSDVILAVRNVDKWNWDTANPQGDLKSRNLPIRADIAPDFRLIYAKWLSRKKAAEAVAAQPQA